MKSTFRLRIVFLLSILISGNVAYSQSLDEAVQNINEQLVLYPREKVYVQTDRPHYVSGDKLYFRAFVLNSVVNQPSVLSRYCYVELINSSDSVAIRLQIRPENNMHYGAMDLPITLPQGDYRLRAYTRYMENDGVDYFHTQPIFIGDPKSLISAVEEKQEPEIQDFAVSFFPEGGYLVDGQVSAVAFKAMSGNGDLIDIEGTIYNQNDEDLIEFSTFHDGMGVFNLQFNPNTNYYALCRWNGQTQRVDLPQVMGEAYALRCTSNGDLLYVSVNRSKTQPTGKLYLIAHHNGAVLYADEWDMNQEYLAFEQSFFPSGINQFLLVNENYEKLSERMVFCLNESDKEPLNICRDDKRYDIRDRVEMELSLQNPMADSLRFTTFAVSVTDDRDVKLDTTRNIMTDLLLTSELPGYIHNPSYYFEGSRKSRQAADLLMMTHGWTRYDLPSAMRGSFRTPEIAPEQSQRVSGRLLGFLDRPYSEGQVMLFTLPHPYGISEMTASDKDGRFVLDGFELPDSTLYILNAYTKKGKDGVLLEVDKTSYPPLSSWKKPIVKEKISPPDIYEKTQTKYLYRNNELEVHLREVDVVGRGRRISKFQDARKPGINDKVIDKEVLEDYKTSNPQVFLMQVAPVSTWYDEASQTNRLVVRSLRSTTSSTGYVFPLIVVDGRRFPEGDILALNAFWPDEVERVVISNSNSYYGSDGDNTVVIEIFTDRGPVNVTRKYNRERFTPLGYQKPVEFYSPVYDSPHAVRYSEPDLRSTIYWKPDGLLDMENDSVRLKFYTADYDTTYSIVVEGVSSDGKIIYERVPAAIEVKAFRNKK